MMKKITCLIVVMLFGVCFLSLSLAAEVSVDSAEAHKWIKDRLQEAQNGKTQLVQLPIVRRGDNWGCVCPEYFVSNMTVGNITNVWLTPVFGKGVKPIDHDKVNIAEGFFTGKTMTRDFRTNKATQPEEWVYTLLEFRVSKLIPYDQNQSVDVGYAGNILKLLPE